MARSSRKSSDRIEVQTTTGGAGKTLALDSFNLLASRPGRRTLRWRAVRVGRKDWYLVEPSSVEDALDSFNEACEELERGHVKKAEKILRRILKAAPEHIDVMHHLAMILNETDREDDALRLWTRGVEVGRAALPSSFRRGNDRLDWGGSRTGVSFAASAASPSRTWTEGGRKRPSTSTVRLWPTTQTTTRASGSVWCNCTSLSEGLLMLQGCANDSVMTCWLAPHLERR